MKSKKVLWRLRTVLLMAMVALAGCSSTSGNQSSSAGEVDVTQELTYASTTKVVGLSPIKTNDSVSSRVIEQIYETLFVRDPKTMEIVPKLAKSYETPDTKTWIIKLRKGIKFHDGTNFNAKAVKYTFDTFRDPKTAAPRASLLEPIESIEVKDEYTVVIRTKQPYGPMLAALSHTNASIVSPTADKKGTLNKEPVGTGPFQFVEWANGDHVTLEANEAYWQDPPKLEKVTFKIVPKVNTAVSMLQTGEVQLIDGLTAEHLPRLQSLKNVKLMKKEGTPISYLGFNMNKRPTKDLVFRQAVAHAINREAYVKKLKGLVVKSNSIIGPKVFGYDQSIEKLGYEYDLEKAKQLIKENGYEGKEIKMLVANTPVYMKMAQIVQAQLSDVGLNPQIETMEWGTFLDVSKQGAFDITFLGWTNSTADGSELLYPNLHTDNIGSSNRTRYSNPAFDKLVDESRNIVDQDLRKQKLIEANKIAVESLPWLVMNHGMVTAAYDQSVKGFKMDPTGQWSLYDVYRE